MAGLIPQHIKEERKSLHRKSGNGPDGAPGDPGVLTRTGTGSTSRHDMKEYWKDLVSMHEE